MGPYGWARAWACVGFVMVPFLEWAASRIDPYGPWSSAGTERFGAEVQARRGCSELTIAGCTIIPFLPRTRLIVCMGQETAVFGSARVKAHSGGSKETKRSCVSLLQMAAGNES